MFDNQATAPAERAEGCWLVFDYPNNPTIRLDARILDRILASDDELVLVVDELILGVEIIGGRGAATAIVEQLAPYTRSAPLTTPQAYEAARRRLQSARSGSATDGGLYFGDEVVRVSADILTIGDFRCWISDVARYAEVGAAIRLPNGFMDSTLAMLLVGSLERREDIPTLSRLIAAYETEHT